MNRRRRPKSHSPLRKTTSFMNPPKYVLRNSRDGTRVCFTAGLCSNHGNKSEGTWWTDEEHTWEACSVSMGAQMSALSWGGGVLFTSLLHLGNLHP